MEKDLVEEEVVGVLEVLKVALVVEDLEAQKVQEHLVDHQVIIVMEVIIQ
jgi:hypothetical protein